MKLFSVSLIVAIAAVVVFGTAGSGRTAESAALPLVQSANATNSVTSLRTAYPEWQNFSVKKINAIYETVPRLIQRPGIPREFAQFVCDSGGYSFDWAGAAPPNCTQTGTFFRSYTAGRKAAAEAVLTLPDEHDSLTSLPSGVGAAAFGFIYIEGWPAIGATNSEGGLAYAAGSQTYEPYLAVPGKPESAAKNWHVLPGSTVYLRVGSDENPHDMTTLPPWQKPVPCSSGCTYLIVAVLEGPGCPAGTICIDRERELSSGWKGNCCIFGLMTTIARNSWYRFDGNYTFGPITWHNPYTETENAPARYHYDGCAQAAPQQQPESEVQAPRPAASPAGQPCRSAAFSHGGVQLYPNSSRYVLASGESVTIRNP